MCMLARLKLGIECQYQLNAEGSTTVKLLGLDYKSTLKPALASFEESIKKGSMEKLEELISLQQQSAEVEAKIEAKRNKAATCQSEIEEVKTSSSVDCVLSEVLLLLYCLILINRRGKILIIRT